MNDLQAYKLYKALKMHFTTEQYDYFKYKGRITVNEKEFLKNKYWAGSLLKEYDKKLPSFLVANFSVHPNIYIRELYNNSDNGRIYREWSKVRQAHKYNFISDLNKLSDDLSEELFSKEIPSIVKRYIRKEISKETVCIILRETNTLKLLNEQHKGDILWEQYNFGFEKYMPFALKKEEYSKILLDKYGTISYK